MSAKSLRCKLYLGGNSFLRQHFTSLKGQPTAGGAISVKKCVFMEIPDLYCVCLYVDDFWCMCVAKPPLDCVHVFKCFVIIGVCVGKLVL